MSVKVNSTIFVGGGHLLKVTHDSKVLKLPANFNIFLPPAALGSSPKKVPVLFYLCNFHPPLVDLKLMWDPAGLTCTADNCSEKGGFFNHAAKAGIAMVLPDTSPRGAGVEGEDESWDFGTGAGFYIDATEPGWKDHYKMYTYVTEELPELVFKEYPIDSSRMSITGHSMGGHGALTLFLRNPGKYKSVSAFAPISHPSDCPWGQKAFTGYFGVNNKSKWAEHDATELIKKYKGPKPDILIDVGKADNFYKQGQLLPEHFEAAAKEAGLADSVKVRYQEGYDHSYYFMSTFAEDHVAHAAKHLK